MTPSGRASPRAYGPARLARLLHTAGVNAVPTTRPKTQHALDAHGTGAPVTAHPGPTVMCAHGLPGASGQLGSVR